MKYPMESCYVSMAVDLCSLGASNFCMRTRSARSRAVTAAWRQSTRIFTDFRVTPVSPWPKARIQNYAAPSCTFFIPLFVGPWLVRVSGSSVSHTHWCHLPDVHLQLGQRVFLQTDSPQRALAGLLIGKAVCTADKAATLSWEPPLPLNGWALQAGHLQVATHRRQWLLFIPMCGHAIFQCSLPF